MRKFYNTNNFILIRCNNLRCEVYRKIVINREIRNECEYCGQMCARLLGDGTWQTQAERDTENMKALGRMAG